MLFCKAVSGSFICCLLCCVFSANLSSVLLCYKHHKLLLCSQQSWSYCCFIVSSNRSHPLCMLLLNIFSSIIDVKKNPGSITCTVTPQSLISILQFGCSNSVTVRINVSQKAVGVTGRSGLVLVYSSKRDTAHGRQLKVFSRLLFCFCQKPVYSVRILQDSKNLYFRKDKFVLKLVSNGIPEFFTIRVESMFRECVR